MHRSIGVGAEEEGVGIGAAVDQGGDHLEGSWGGAGQSEAMRSRFGLPGVFLGREFDDPAGGEVRVLGKQRMESGGGAISANCLGDGNRQWDLE